MTLVATAAAGVPGAARGGDFTLCTFGDSVLDCGHYNDRGVTPGGLLVRNDDALFPDFAGKDIASRRPAQLIHCAADGATVDGLASQLKRVPAVRTDAVAMLSIGGNDLLRGVAADTGRGVREFERKLAAFVRELRVRPLLVATIYDPTFGDDARNFLGIDPRIARANHERVNGALRELAARHGELVDVHAHFLRGDPSWFTHTIEPSLRGASEVRRAFLPSVLAHAGR